MEHPAWGPLHVSDHLLLGGVTVSAGTVSNSWPKENIETQTPPWPEITSRLRSHPWILRLWAIRGIKLSIYTPNVHSALCFQDM